MGFPYIVNWADSIESVDTVTHDVVVPTGHVDQDDLLLISVLNGSNITSSGHPAGWSLRLGNFFSNVSWRIYEKTTTDGNEVDFTYTSSASEQSVNRVLRIRKASSSVNSGLKKEGVQSELGFYTLPLSGGRENLWMAVACFHGSIPVARYPIGWTPVGQSLDSGNGTAGAGLAIAFRQQYGNFMQGKVLNGEVPFGYGRQDHEFWLPSTSDSGAFLLAKTPSNSTIVTAKNRNVSGGR